MRLGAVFRSWKAWLAIVVVAVLSVPVSLYAAAGYFDRDPVHLFGEIDRPEPIAAVLFSGDMGLRFGLGPYVANAMADRGVPVLGVASPTQFRFRRTRAEVDAIVANGIRETLAKTGARKVIVIGQSFGSDIARVGLVDLPADLRAKVASVVLVVPGQTAFFRADPSGLAYRGAPDAGPAEARRLDWIRLTCIRGAAETDSLCPSLTMPNVRTVSLPGGHFLNSDHSRLIATVLGALAHLLPPPTRIPS